MGETLPFIVEDTLPEASQPVYIGEKWRVKFVALSPLGKHTIHSPDNCIRTVRKLKRTGISTSSNKNEELFLNYPRTQLRDKFIKINGIEIY